MASCSGVGTLLNKPVESLYVGTEDGWVYELDRGTSFDGERVDAYVRMAFNGVGSATQKKRWHSVTLEVDVESDVSLGLIADFAYSNPYQPASGELPFQVSGGGALWDEGVWNRFIWSAPTVGRAKAYIAGVGENMSLIIISEATSEQPHTLCAATLNFSYRGLVR